MMLSHTTKTRVRYGHVDQMGYVYYGKYAEYFEIGRTEMIRSLGIPYKLIEEKGFMLPVANMELKYYTAATYDTLLTITTTITEIPMASFKTEYEIHDESGNLVVKGKVKLAFVSSESRKPVRAPQFVKDAIASAWPSS